jgi:hypothetical protein
MANSILIYQNQGEMAELAEGARLLSECGGKLPPRVRIPLSPPLKKGKHERCKFSYFRVFQIKKFYFAGIGTSMASIGPSFLQILQPIHLSVIE